MEMLASCFLILKLYTENLAFQTMHMYISFERLISIEVISSMLVTFFTRYRTLVLLDWNVTWHFGKDVIYFVTAGSTE